MRQVSEDVFRQLCGWCDAYEAYDRACDEVSAAAALVQASTALYAVARGIREHPCDVPEDMRFDVSRFAAEGGRGD